MPRTVWLLMERNENRETREVVLGVYDAPQKADEVKAAKELPTDVHHKYLLESGDLTYWVAEWPVQ